MEPKHPFLISSLDISDGSSCPLDKPLSPDSLGDIYGHSVLLTIFLWLSGAHQVTIIIGSL